MTRMDEAHNLKVLKTVINKYLDETIFFTEESLKSLHANRDDVVWDLATKIYRESGHRAELSLIRDVVNSRIDAIKCQLDIAEETRRLAERDFQFLNKVTEALGKFGGNESKARIFVRVRKKISDQLAVDEREVSLDSYLSNHLGADELDLIELVIALEEEFDIEISDVESENELGISPLSTVFTGGSCWSSGSSSSYSSFRNAGEKCIVRNFVELICKKVED